jgi:hypothetical protein
MKSFVNFKGNNSANPVRDEMFIEKELSIYQAEDISQKIIERRV